VMSPIGAANKPSFVEIQEVTLQFFVDLLWNDPYTVRKKTLAVKNFGE